MSNNNIAESFSLDFEVKKVIYTNKKTKFMIIQAKVLNVPKDVNIPREMNVQGVIPTAYKKDTFKGKGVVETHHIYGRYIKLIETPETILPQVEGALVDFIKRRVKGVGVKKAELIVNTLGLDAITKISNNHEVLLECGFKEKDTIRIQEELTYHKKFEELVHFLQSIKVEVDMASEIYKALKHGSVSKIRANPYIISNIGKLNWLDSDRIAKALNFLPNFTPRYRHAILYYLNYHLEYMGDICVKKESLLSDFETGFFLKHQGSYKKFPYVERSVLEPLLNELVNERALVSSKSEDGETYLYTPGYYYIEESIIKGLDELMNGRIMPFCDPLEIDNFLASYEKQFFTLAKNQREAVYASLGNRLSILTGGPGTGKTQTTNAIVKCIKSIEPKSKIMLLAPTGKASKRLSELTGMSAKTIHRGLGLKGFGSDEELTKLEADFIIVDEFSMTDAYLFNLLINQISEHTRLILIGDYHQLPSVGPGLILRDLIGSGKIPVTELTEIFRQAASSQLVTNAHKMNDGLTTTDVGGLKFDPKKGDSYFVERSQPLQIQEDVVESMRRFIKKGYKLDDFLILTPMHSGILGTVELNQKIQREFNPPTTYVDVQRGDGTLLRIGDRVIQTENNYDLDVFNGEIGTILDIFSRRSSGTEEMIIEIEFPDKDNPIEFGEKEFDELELAYCITIHKSQGSEAPIVIMPIHETQQQMLDRVLIYTGYTRTRDTHIFIGRKELLNQSLQKVNTDNRQSLIKEKIQKVI